MKRNLFGKFKTVRETVVTEPIIEKTAEDMLAEIVLAQTIEEERIYDEILKRSLRRDDIFNIKSLVRSECANYFEELNKVKHYCPFRQVEAGSVSSKCIYFEEFSVNTYYKSTLFDNTGDHIRCDYFEKGVLPLRSELEVVYRKRRELKVELHNRICKCGKRIVVSKSRESCDKCAAK